jgi:hypothetical protein
LRSLEKVKNGETRYFSGSPLFYVILCRIFFGSFEHWIKLNKIVNSICVGINPFCDDWELLARQLQRFFHVSAGDFKKFDKSQLRVVLWYIGYFIRQMYNDGYDDIRAALWDEVVNSRQLIGSVIYEFLHGLPSGHLLTTIINSIYVLFSFFYCWYLAHSMDNTCLVTFDDHMVVQTYGDDSVISMDDYAAGLFDQVSLPELMNYLCLEFTSENKSIQYTHRSNIYAITFLKRSFRYEPLLGRHVSPLNMDTIMEIPYWTKVKNSAQVVRTNVEVSITELSQYPEEVYRAKTRLIVEGMTKRMGVTPVCYPRVVVLDLLVGGQIASIGKKMRLNINTMHLSKNIDNDVDRLSPVKVELDGTSDGSVQVKGLVMDVEGAYSHFDEDLVNDEVVA